MPAYDYTCSSCKHTFEAIHKIDDRRTQLDKPCPNCQKSGDVDILVSTPAIGDPIRLGITKPSGEFKERMELIKKNHPLGTYRY